MRKIKAESNEAQAKPAGFKFNRVPFLIMVAIVFIAAFVRVAFAIGTSAGSDFALSGGSTSTNNLYILSELVANGTLILTDGSVFYPYGTATVSSVLFALLMYPFAALANVFVSDPVLASSMVLATSGPVFAVLAVIASYYLGKQVLRSRLAGYLVALFVALCPIFIRESVFSNGTGTSFVLFLLIIAVYFLYRAVETVGYKEGEEATRKKAYGFSAISGIFLALVALSWTGYRAILLPILTVMVIQVLIDRFKGKDPMPMAVVYSLAVIIMAAVSAVYYAPLGLWTEVASGTVFLAVFISALCTGFAAMRKTPWTITIPAFAVVAVVVLAVLAFVMPDFFNAIVSGNSVYDSAYAATLGDMKLSLSTLSTYYGPITYWFLFIAVIGMLCRFNRNSGSSPFIFLLVWMFVTTLTCGHNSVEAAIATPAFALGFAAVVVWVLAHVDFKAYFAAIKTAAGKLKVRRILSPAPLASLVVALLLVAGPNAMYAIDAAIPSNDASDYNEQVDSVIGTSPFGALGYYVKTDESWKVRDAMKAISTDPDASGGALATWIDYSTDAPLYGGLKSYTDTNGRGAVGVSNILLGDAITGESSAAILLNAIIYLGGVTEDVRTALGNAGFSASTIDMIDNVLKDASFTVGGKTVRYIVTTDVDTYGKVGSDISDENVKYLFLTNYIASECPLYTINEAYDKLSDSKDLATPFIMVTGDMMPFYYGYAGIFNEMALLNAYNVDTSTYTVSKFTQFGYYAYYYGIYGFTDAMYDTLLYRTYIGMSPAEAGYSSIYEYMVALSNADASVRMCPGYGLSNYTVVYWQVMYNPDDNAETSGDGWVQMDGNEAIAKQKLEGGRINYLSGLPVIVKYTPNSTGSEISGSVNGVTEKGEVRVSAYDAAGNLCSTTFTDASGNYKLYVKDPANTTLMFYAGSSGVTGGFVFATCSADAVTTPTVAEVDVELSLGYKLSSGISPTFNINGCSWTVTNTVTGEEHTFTTGNETSRTIALVYGTYDVTVKRGDTTIYSGSFSTGTSATAKVDMWMDAYEYSITLKDGNVSGVGIWIDVVGANATVNDIDKSDDGTFKFTVPKGDYVVYADGYWIESPSFSVSSAGSKTITVTSGVEVTLNGSNFEGKTVEFMNDVYTTSVYVPVGGTSVVLPASAYGPTAYRVSYMNGGTVYVATVSDIANYTDASLYDFKDSVSGTISGVLKNSSGVPVSGTVTLYYVDDSGNFGNMMFKTTAASDGTFKFYNVPTGKDKLIYATDGSSQACFVKSPGTETSGITVNMVEADKITASPKWSSVSMPYLNVKVSDLGIEGLNGSMYFNTDSNGSYKFFLPKDMGAKVTVTLDGSGNLRFKDGDVTSLNSEYTVDSENRSPSYTVYLTRSSTVTGDMKVVLVNDLDPALDSSYLKAGSVETTVGGAATEGFTVTYSVSFTLGKIGTGSDPSGYYYASGTYYLDPNVLAISGDTFKLSLREFLGVSDISEISYTRAVVSGLADGVSVDVDGTDFKIGNTVSEGKEYLLKTKDLGTALMTFKSDGKILYRQVSIDDAVDVHVNASVLNDAVTVKGFAGAVADGTLTVTLSDGVAITADVNDGTYSVVIYKSDNAKFEFELSKDNTTYTSEFDNINVAEDSTKNFAINGASSVASVEVGTEVTIEGTGVYKKVTMVIDNVFENEGDTGAYYSIKLGSAWESAVVVDGNDINVSKIYVPAEHDNEKVTVIGYYNSSLYSLTSSEMMVTFSSSSHNVYVFITDTTAAYDGSVYVNKTSDNVGGNTYSYVFEINNLAKEPCMFKLTGVDALIDSGKWAAMVEFSAFDSIYVCQDVSLPEYLAMYDKMPAVPGLCTYKITLVPLTDD
ncbi:MAG: STT3 domain-containing protein, partial [Candidatus Methanomethylophilaceae archaeon]